MLQTHCRMRVSSSEPRDDAAWAQNIEVDKCQQGHQVPLLMVFRFFKQRFDQWSAELAAVGQELPSYDAAGVCCLRTTHFVHRQEI